MMQSTMKQEPTKNTSSTVATLRAEIGQMEAAYDLAYAARDVIGAKMLASTACHATPLRGRCDGQIDLFSWCPGSSLDFSMDKSSDDKLVARLAILDGECESWRINLADRRADLMILIDSLASAKANKSTAAETNTWISLDVVNAVLSARAMVRGVCLSPAAFTKDEEYAEMASLVSISDAVVLLNAMLAHPHPLDPPDTSLHAAEMRGIQVAVSARLTASRGSSMSRTVAVNVAAKTVTKRGPGRPPTVVWAVETSF